MRRHILDDHAVDIVEINPLLKGALDMHVAHDEPRLEVDDLDPTVARVGDDGIFQGPVGARRTTAAAHLDAVVGGVRHVHTPHGHTIGPLAADTHVAGNVDEYVLDKRVVSTVEVELPGQSGQGDIRAEHAARSTPLQNSFEL